MKKKPSYLMAPISLEMERDLTAALKCGSLANLKGKGFTTALETINQTILHNYRRNKRYEKYHPTKPEPFNARTLHRYFSGANIKADRLQALMIFLDYEPDRLELGPRQKKTDEPETGVLEGAWFSYVYDPSETTENKVKRTVLYLTRRPASSRYDVQYEGLRGRFQGSAEVFRNSFFFSIESTDAQVRIFLCAELPLDGSNLTSKQIILNVYCLSNSVAGHSVISQVVMVKNDRGNVNPKREGDIAKFLAQKPVTLIYAHLSPDLRLLDPERPLEQWKERQIIAYLSRNKAVNKRIQAFIPNSFEHLIARNNNADLQKSHDNYDKLKIKLSDRTFYTFNRFSQRSNEVAVFSYTFAWNDAEKICMARRHPIGNPHKIDFSGEVLLKAEKIYMNLRDPNMQRQRQFIAPFDASYNAVSKSIVFRGITSTVSAQTGHPMALRELILGMPDEPESGGESRFMTGITDNDKTNGFIPYSSFSQLPEAILKAEEKLFLANKAQSTLRFPGNMESNFTYFRQDRARKCEGSYTLFTANSDPAKGLLKMQLTIDRLAQVTLMIKIHIDPELESFNLSYQGYCEFYNNSLRISANLVSKHPNDEKHADFVSHPVVGENNRLIGIFMGINLTTDNQDRPLARRFLVIDNTLLKEQTIADFSDFEKLMPRFAEMGIDTQEISLFVSKKGQV